jgi:DNA-binding NarL/FixJ family response regulator
MNMKAFNQLECISESFSIEKKAVSSSDKIILIESPQRLQDELLIDYLERETKVKCLLISSLQDVVVLKDEYSGTPTIVLLDCSGKSKKEVLARLTTDDQELFSQCYVCLFNVPSEKRIEIETIKLGVRGLFFEKDSPEHFLKGIKLIFNGELWIQRKFLNEFILNTINKEMSLSYKDKDAILLTTREIEILGLIAVGASNAEMADKLFISLHTVKTHVYNIFKKINATNRLQAALWAANNL